MDDLRKDLKKIEDKFIKIGLDYSKKIVNCQCNDINLLRGSLLYRNGAIGYQLELIQNYRTHLTDLLDQKDGFKIAQDLSIRPSRKLNYHFDDLIFNIMSFYDYLAAYVIYVFYGEEIRDSAVDYDPLSFTNEKFGHLIPVLRKINWTEFAKLIREGEKSKLKYNPKVVQESSTSNEVLEFDNSYIIHISRLRNDIIHNKASIVGQSLSYDLTAGAEFNFSAPAKFQEFFPDLETNYMEAVRFIIQNFTDSILKIADSLLEDIESNRNTEKGDEWISFESKD